MLNGNGSTTAILSVSNTYTNGATLPVSQTRWRLGATEVLILPGIDPLSS